jgi:uncharacterized membrane protein
MPAEAIRSSVRGLVAAEHPGFGEGDRICLSDLDRYRAAFIETLLVSERGSVSDLEKEVVESLRLQETVAADLNAEHDQKFTFGERLADRIATFGGSWTFILTFLGILGFWLFTNSVQLVWRPFDRYPFILLNLVLSCLAALQAPVIMMSQRRLESRDRLRAEQDFRTNLKAELEIRYLNTKIDQLLTGQWEHLIEIQQIQVELMEELERRLPAREGTES